MTLDPVREARARKMVLDQSTWPLPYLPMKRIGVPMDFGIILSDHALPDSITISYPDDRTITFKSIDDLVADNWTVD